MKGGESFGSAKPAVVAAGAILLAVLLAGGVYFFKGMDKGPGREAEQDPEDKIIITIQTQSPEEVVEAEPVAETPAPDRSEVDKSPDRSHEGRAASSPPPSTSVKASRNVQPDNSKEVAAAGRPESSHASSQPSAGRTEVPSNQEASLRPMTAPKSPDGSFEEKTDLEKIKTVVRRQEVAFEGKDVDLYMADLISQTPKLRKDIESFFEKFSDIEIDFKVEDVKIKGPSAEVILQQETRLVPKSSSRTQTAKARILWGLLKVGSDWKINETKILDSR